MCIENFSTVNEYGTKAVETAGNIEIRRGMLKEKEKYGCNLTRAPA
jgi:hypothetical protein